MSSPTRSVSRLYSTSWRSGRLGHNRLRVEQLEQREVPTVALSQIPDQGFFTDRPLFIPVTPANVPTGAGTVSASSNNSGVKVEVLSTSPSLRLTVAGKDNTGAAFTGTMTLRLFPDAAPLATGLVIQ